jgi:hypothetical protein
MMLEVVGAVLEDGNNMTRNTAARTAMVALFKLNDESKKT